MGLLTDTLLLRARHSAKKTRKEMRKLEREVHRMNSSLETGDEIFARRQAFLERVDREVGLETRPGPDGCWRGKAQKQALKEARRHGEELVR